MIAKLGAIGAFISKVAGDIKELDPDSLEAIKAVCSKQKGNVIELMESFRDRDPKNEH